MDNFDVYTITIAISSVIIISYFFNYVSKKTKIPSVLLLIGLGIGINEWLKYYAIDLNEFIHSALELLGVVGLIMIVLEAALDLKLEKEKKPLLIRSTLVATLSLLATTFAIGYLLHYYFLDDFFTALLYAIPLSILSSAIVIPSVESLVGNKKEFMIYESTISDILGIMFFYFMISGKEASGAVEITTGVTSSIAITVVLALVLSYVLVILLQKLTLKVKLYFLISLLVFLYAIGKSFHLSSLLIILVFGLVLNNYSLFFRGKLKSFIQGNTLDVIREDFHVVTMETAFVVRTFFFVIFGMTLDFTGIFTDLPAIYVSVGIIAITYLLRYLMLRTIVGKNITPQLWIAPRGLITVLLFFSIPVQLADPNFNPTILLIVILATSFIMSAGLISKTEDIEDKDELEFDWDELDQEILEGTKK